ncbi:MAG: sulfur carrier protein ThiS [Verrucomicrobiota bacterium]
MNIQLNGESRSCPDSFTLAELIVELGFEGQPVLVELNGEPVHVRDHKHTRLKEGDSLELVRIVAGG